MAKIITPSLFESNSISRRFERNQERGEFKSVTITGTDFLAGLTRVKAKILSEIGSGSRVRSGPRWVTGLKAFSLARAGWVKPG
jgi:hypothetical protein